MYSRAQKGTNEIFFFRVAIMNMEKNKQLTSLSGFSEHFSVVALLWVDEHQADCHHDSAPAVILQQWKFPGSHLQSDLRTGDPKNAECLLSISYGPCHKSGGGWQLTGTIVS